APAAHAGSASSAAASAPSTGATAPAARIDFRHPVPSAAVVRALRAFADDLPAGVAPPPPGTAHGAQPDGLAPAAPALRLTPASLRRAAQEGLDADGVIDLLARWHAGPLPAEVVAMVQQWTKDWGTGALAKVTLLRVQAADILAALLADPEIGPH